MIPTLILRLSLALAIVWMVKQKALSPALHLLAQVTSRGEKLNASQPTVYDCLCVQYDMLRVSHSVEIIGGLSSAFIWTHIIKHFLIDLSVNSFVSSHRGIPNYDFKIGKITFIRNSRPQPRKFADDVRNVKFLIMLTIYCASVPHTHQPLFLLFILSIYVEFSKCIFSFTHAVTFSF